MFDDLCDNYVENIKIMVDKITFINKTPQIENETQEQLIIKFMYDCRGMINVIDVTSIFKLFMKRIEPILKIVFS